MTSVSVVIPTFERAHVVGRAVLSVFGQTSPPSEVIVVDDGSSDGTPSVLEAFGDRIRVLRHPRNLGVAAARNTGVAAALSPLVAFLDSDDWWLPQKLALQVPFLESRPGWVACQTDEIWVRRGVRVNPGLRHRKPLEDVFVPSLRLCLVSPSAVIVRVSLLRELCGFDERLPVCEDYDLWLRIGASHPIPLYPVPLLVKEGGHEDQLSRRYQGMDRFRIYALVKLLCLGLVTGDKALAVQGELHYKCRIYGSGCLKRGRQEEGHFFLGLPGRILRDQERSILEAILAWGAWT